MTNTMDRGPRILGTIIENITGQQLLIPEEELRKVDAIGATLNDPACEQCGKPFERRKGSGGKPQRFCSPVCRATFHAEGQRSERSPTYVERLMTPAIESPPTSAATGRCLLAQQDLIEIDRDEHGNLVLRQSSWPDDDAVILIHRDHEQQFLDNLCDFLGIASVP